MAMPTLLLAIAAITTGPQITAEQVPIQHTADGGEAQVMRTPPIGEVVALLVVVSGCEIPSDVPLTSADRLVVLLEEADPTTTAVIAPIADTYLRRDRANQNRGSGEFLRVRSSGDNRALIQFDHGAIEEAVGSGSLEGATLELTITHNGNNWGRRGQRVAVHRMTQVWTELGATWNCANDVDTSNRRRDCEGSGWRMGRKRRREERPFAKSRTATARIKNAQTGVVTFDVTRDVEAFLAGDDPNLGWLIKQQSEHRRGRVEFGSRESSAPARLLLAVEQQETNVVPPEGGTVARFGFGSITFPAGAFAEPQAVKLDAFASTSQEADFDFVTSLTDFVTGHVPLVYRVVVPALPATDVAVSLELPDGFAAGLDAGETLRVWARECQCSDVERIDHYERQSGVVEIDVTANVLKATIKRGAFTTERRADGDAELLLIVAVERVDPGSAQAANRPVSAPGTAQLSAVCQLLPLGSSLPGRHVITPGRAYNLDIPHRGVDYRAGTGTLVLAARGGTVARVDIERDSIGVEAGWGYHVVLLHPDRTLTVYAHLVSGSAAHIPDGVDVVQGEVLGLANATGRSDGSHLHLAYYAPGATEKVDPDPCLTETPFSGIWVGASRMNRQLVNLGHDGEGNLITIITRPDVPQSRWVLRQTVAVPPLPDQLVKNDTAVVGAGTLVVVDGTNTGEISYALRSDGEGRIARLVVGDIFFGDGTIRDVSGLPYFKIKDPSVDPVTASTYPLIPSGTYDETAIEGVIWQDSITTQTVPTGPTAPDTLFAELSFEYRAPPFPATVLRIEEFVLTREVPEGITTGPLVARAVQRTKPPGN